MNVERALCANPNCIDICAGRERVILRLDNEPDRREMVVRVSREPEGFVYAHVFHDIECQIWRALLLLSSTNVTRDADMNPMQIFHHEIIEGHNFEPLLTLRPGDASAIAPDWCSAVNALVEMLNGYSNSMLGLPGSDRAGTLDCAPVDAYARWTEW